MDGKTIFARSSRAGCYGGFENPRVLGVVKRLSHKRGEIGPVSRAFGRRDEALNVGQLFGRMWRFARSSQSAIVAGESLGLSNVR
jgi:hypothetical protein